MLYKYQYIFVIEKMLMQYFLYTKIPNLHVSNVEETLITIKVKNKS